MKNSLLFVFLLGPMLLLGQFGLINEIGWVSEERDSVWIEVYIPNYESVNLNELNLYYGNKLVWTPDEITLFGHYFSIALPSKIFDSNLSKKSVFSPGHEELELIHNGNKLHAAPMKCIPFGSSLSWQGFSFLYSENPSRNQENPPETLILTPDSIELSHAGGFYEQSIEVELLNELHENHEIRWNTGGSVLEMSSSLLPESGLVVTPNTSVAELSYIEASGYQLDPSGEIHTAEVRCFQVFERGCPVSDISRNTYFLHEGDKGRYDLSVVSITTEDLALFGSNGIYGYGDSGINFDLRGRTWEKPATIEFFESGELKLQQNIGLRIRGKSSRYSPQKSFKIYAREDYGKKKMENVFFPALGDEKLKRINLRTPHNDFIQSLLTDHVAMNLAAPLDIDAPNSKRAVLYLNGEFWGLYAIQESIDQHYPETNFDINDDDVLVIDSDDPWPDEYSDILSFVKQRNAIDAADLQYLSERIDLKSMMDYYALQIFLANWDWPQKNVKAWMSTQGAPLRYFLFDGDACFNEIEHQSIERFYPELNTADHSIVFSALMTNQQFRSEFMSVLLKNMKEHLSTPKVLDAISEAHDEIDPLMNQQIARWGYPQSKVAWENSVQSMNLFAIYRQQEIMESIEKMFGELVPAYPNPLQPGGTVFFDSFGMFSDEFDFKIFDRSGRVVAEGKSTNDQITNLSLETGSYVVLLNANGFSRPSKFIVN